MGKEGDAMKIELEVMSETPLAIADAIIERETNKAIGCGDGRVARESIRQIGQALINYVWSCERLDEGR